MDATELNVSIPLMPAATTAVQDENGAYVKVPNTMVIEIRKATMKLLGVCSKRARKTPVPSMVR